MCSVCVSEPGEGERSEEPVLYERAGLPTSLCSSWYSVCTAAVAVSSSSGQPVAGPSSSPLTATRCPASPSWHRRCTRSRLSQARLGLPMGDLQSETSREQLVDG